MSNIAVVVPTIRPELFALFLKKWDFSAVELVTVWDGESPEVEHRGQKYSLESIAGEDADLIPNLCAGVRNLGFLFVAKHLPHIEYVITLDDDMEPHGDTLLQHISILNTRLPGSWFSTALGAYMRGFPYGVRQETEVVLSHGTWIKNPDWDAPTQLLNGNADHTAYYQGLIPKGLYFPFCGMNVAFKRKALPYVYYAPVNTFSGAERFDDIWAGVAFKPEFDELGWGIATGYASCVHSRASNVYTNLQKEAVGIEHNELFWKGEQTHPFFKEFKSKRERWNKLIKSYEEMSNNRS